MRRGWPSIILAMFLTRIIHEVLSEDRKGTVLTVPFRSNQRAR
jgi:hypothetical protein